MKIVKAKHEILTAIDGVQELKELERIARVCYKSEGNISEGPESAEKLIKVLISNGHEAMLEHKSFSVIFRCDRAISHEIVRHRMASFAQESQRYCNYSKDKFDNEVQFIQPWWMDEEDDLGYYTWLKDCKNAEKNYLKLLEDGYSPQQARIVLPNCTKTEIVVTANYREWRHILKLRTAPDAYPDMRNLMLGLLNELKQKLPVIFDDI